MTACKPIILIVIHVKNKNAYIIATGFFLVTKVLLLRIAICRCCDLETMVSRLECTRVHFVQVSVLVSRPTKKSWQQHCNTLPLKV